MADAKPYIATAPLFIGYARAYNPGDVVDADAVKANGWQDSVAREGTKAAGNASAETAAAVGIPPAQTPPPPEPKK